MAHFHVYTMNTRTDDSTYFMVTNVPYNYRSCFIDSGPLMHKLQFGTGQPKRWGLLMGAPETVVSSFTFSVNTFMSLAK